MKNHHEIRDPIHIFIRLSSDERKIVDSVAFQRLRNIHQLALTYLVYPGATHKRFEHSLGVMELADRIYNVITEKENVSDKIRSILPELEDNNKLEYWRTVLRMAALLHDVGHLPFSHAAEKELLPNEWDHEKLTREVILSDEISGLLGNMCPPIKPEQVVKLAIGKKKAPDLEFSPWEEILSEVIGGNFFGADRMDYLLRDSHHTGVSYGKFDHYRLIDTLRLLIKPSQEGSEEEIVELGIEGGGIHAAEALILARYFMFTQVYFHPVRRIYDIHLKDFLQNWLKDGKFSIELQGHLELTDAEVIVELRRASMNNAKSGHALAKRIVDREHYKLLYERNPNDVIIHPECTMLIYNAAVEKFGEDKIKHDSYTEKGGPLSFPVLLSDRRVVDSLSESSVLDNLPLATFGYVFISRDIEMEGKKWLEKNRDDIINQPLE